jgi:hypothetical protein
MAVLCMSLFGCADLPDTPADIDALVSMDISQDLQGDVGSRPQQVDVRLLQDRGVDDLGAPIDDASPIGSLDAGIDQDAAPPVTAEPGPILYGAGRTHSPLTANVVTRLREIATAADALQSDVFMKIGASSTVSRSTLACFARDEIELGAYTHLRPTLEYFLAGDAAGDTPFDRETLAARSGHSARWAIGGDPSPMEQEMAAIAPSIALIHYGTNDMGLGATYMSAMHGFHESMMALIDRLIGAGVIPILTGISPRGDRASADLWVGAYNAVIRGMAQAYQVPFIDLHHATYDLEGYGLAGDGLHLNGYRGGACVLTPAALEYGYNVRNLVVLESLERVRRARDDEELSDEGASRLLGEGSYESPFIIAGLPFTDARDTRDSTIRRHAVYSACADTNEAGAEYVYRYETDERVQVRAIVLDQGDVDIDLHLLDETGQANGCLDRNHTHLELTLEPGIYHFVLDTFTNNGGDELAGPYLFALLECDEGDVACAGTP